MTDNDKNTFRLRLSIAKHWPHLVSIALFLYLFFEVFLVWELNYYNPGYFFIHVIVSPVILGAFCFLWLAFCLARIVHRWRTDRYGAALPLLSGAIALLGGMFINNSTGIWLKFNDWKYAVDRENFYKLAAQGAVIPAGTYVGEPTITLPSESYLAIGNESAVYKHTPDGPLVLFQTFIGIPDGMSGFLYAPEAIDPKIAWPQLQLEWADVWDEKRHVYFVGNR